MADCRVSPVPGGALRIVLAEGDGTTHTASGTVTAVTRPTALDFELAPLDADGRRLFAARYALRLAGDRRATRLRLTIRIGDIAADAAPAVAGLELGWQQLLDYLEVEVTRGRG